ncbi:MAG: S9 family peptidase [Armatimonadetes bacterium]|nr:S9 family peptidase [Armatimonadota bacterium]
MKTPPTTRREEFKETVHGVVIEDPYRWLEEQNAPETRNWLAEQDRYLHSILDPLAGKAQLLKRLEELARYDAFSVPTQRGDRLFYSRRNANEELTRYCMTIGRGREKTLLDPHPLSPGLTTTYTVHDYSNDGQKLLFGVRDGGADEVDVRLLNIDDLREQPALPAARYLGVSLSHDNKTIYFARREGDLHNVYACDIGGRERKIFEHSYGKETGLSCGLSEDGRWLVISAWTGWSQTDIHLYDTATGKTIPVVVGEKATFSPQIIGDHVFILTDQRAPNRAIYRAPISDPRRANWRRIIDESDQPIQSMDLSAGWIWLEYMKDVTSRVVRFDPDGKPSGELKLPGIGSASGISGRWNDPCAYFTFTTFSAPPSIYRVDRKSLNPSIWKRPNVKRLPAMESKQVWYRSKDGTRVPMFIVHKKGLKPNGDSMTILEGYGGFNSSQMPFYAGSLALWCELGGVYALPSLRGGGEFGEAWHKAGMLDKKQNTFDDFIAAGEWLVENRYTKPSRLSIRGGSNGGLLVGAALTQRPDLFRAVVCTVPLLDMLRYHLFLVGRYWVPEYGSAEDPEQFKYIRAYSPYHNVKKGAHYPAVIFITGDLDTRVDPLHARKMTAMLQWASASGRPIVLHYDLKSGHSGGRPFKKVMEDRIDEMLFVRWQLSQD